MQVTVGQMQKEHVLTSTQYMEFVTPDSPECEECGIPMLRLWPPHNRKLRFFCGHCGKIIEP